MSQQVDVNFHVFPPYFYHINCFISIIKKSYKYNISQTKGGDRGLQWVVAIADIQELLCVNIIENQFSPITRFSFFCFMQISKIHYVVPFVFGLQCCKLQYCHSSFKKKLGRQVHQYAGRLRYAVLYIFYVACACA